MAYIKDAMSPFHFGLYLVLAIAFVLLGVWRFSESRSVSGLRHVGLLIGIAILTILAASQLGLVSLEGVEQCLNETRSRRSKHIVCLFHVRRAAP
jgi:hypothetical protein